MSNETPSQTLPRASTGEGVGLAAIASIATIAAQCDPERCMVRKCVGCQTFESNPEECVRCYGELYKRTPPSPQPSPKGEGAGDA